MGMWYFTFKSSSKLYGYILPVIADSEKLAISIVDEWYLNKWTNIYTEDSLYKRYDKINKNRLLPTMSIKEVHNESNII
jgi:hypothetical protein